MAIAHVDGQIHHVHRIQQCNHTHLACQVEGHILSAAFLLECVTLFCPIYFKQTGLIIFKCVPWLIYLCSFIIIIPDCNHLCHHHHSQVWIESPFHSADQHHMHPCWCWCSMHEKFYIQGPSEMWLCMFLPCTSIGMILIFCKLFPKSLHLCGVCWNVCVASCPFLCALVPNVVCTFPWGT